MIRFISRKQKARPARSASRQKFMVRRVAPSKVTGGGGDLFEDKVVAHFMVCLLTELSPLPDFGTLVSLDFQTRASGWLLDDILLSLSSSHGESHASFSIKSYPQF